MSAILKLRKIDWVLISSVLFLVFFGILELFAISQNDPTMSFVLSKQLIALSLGLSLMFLITFFDYRFFKTNSYAAMIFYVLSLMLLVLVLFIGSDIRGSSAWIKIGSFSIEPVEFVKIALIILLAKYFSQRCTKSFLKLKYYV